MAVRPTSTLARPPGDNASTRETSSRRFREYARTRDPVLRNELVLENAPLVHYLARKFRPGGCIGIEDLVQVGHIGLIAAVERYDPRFGVDFATFAAPTIAGMIKHCLRDESWTLKMPRRVRELAVRLPRLRDHAEQRLGRPPTPAEMAADSGVDEDEILEAMSAAAAYHTSSLHIRMDTDGDEVGDLSQDVMGVDEPAYALLREHEALWGLVAQLHPREQTILRGRFRFELTQSEVAAELGLSQMHVSRLERRALRQLRRLLETDRSAHR
jgi:RNA polymerase sigma-B factor